MNSKRKLARNTAEEEAEILRHAAEDDSPIATKADAARMRPFAEVIGKRMGRPPKENPKEPVNVRYDREVLVFFKSTGDGWQTRMNDVLLDYVREHTPKAKPAKVLPASSKR